MWLILFYTVQLVIPEVCTKFQAVCQAVAEKYLTEKKFTQTTEKAKTIYPLYTSYAGGIMT